jgi:hypothetical protein
VPTNRKRVLFLDGLGCNPDGFKVRYLRGLGYDVVAPMLPDRDFPGSVAIAEAACQEAVPDAIVGYSRGAGVAVALADDRIPRVLIAGALHWVPDDRRFPGRVIALHSAQDDGLPLEGVREQLQRCGIGVEVLRIVGDDHTMIDEPALAALADALGAVLRSEPDSPSRP